MRPLLLRMAMMPAVAAIPRQRSDGTGWNTPGIFP